MSGLEHLALGWSVALTLDNLLYCFFGTLIGTAVGVLPGLGPLATIALLLPLTYGLDPTAALIMLAGIYYGAQYGGSTTSILLRLPGEISSVMTGIDGHQLARQGRAAEALLVAALASFFAGCVATLLIAAFAPAVSAVALEFGPAEYFSLTVLGIVATVLLSRGTALKASAMALLGLLLGTVGTDLSSGQERFAFGVAELVDGIDFVALAIGLFGIAELVRNLEEGDAAAGERLRGSWRLSPREFRRAWPAALRGTAVGALLGVLPGGGAVLGSFAAYLLEKRIAADPQRFGQGAIEGVAGPEAANNAGAQTAFIPLLTLGLPSNAVMALMIGALTLHNIQPGPNVIASDPRLFWGLIVSMWVGNLFLLILNLPLIGLWVRLLSVRYRLLYPAVLMMCAAGGYSIAGSPAGVVMIAVFGAAGYLLGKLDCDPAPLILGFVLGPMMEENLRRALTLAHGSAEVFLLRPLSAALLAAALLLALLALRAPARRREQPSA